MSKKKTQTQDLFSMVDFENDKVSEKKSDEKNVDYADKSEVIEEQTTNDNTDTIGNNDKTMEQKEYKKYSVAAHTKKDREIKSLSLFLFIC